MKESGEKPSDLQALKFAEKLTTTARISGASAPGYASDIISDDSGWLVEIHDNTEGFILKSDGNETLLD